MARHGLTTFRPPAGAVTYPDSARYKGGFGVRSSSSNAIHKVCFDVKAGWWACSCRGWIRWGQCHHLDALGLVGRSAKGQPVPHYITQGAKP